MKLYFKCVLCLKFYKQETTLKVHMMEGHLKSDT
jgi:hypothetical protein